MKILNFNEFNSNPIVVNEQNENLWHIDIECMLSFNYKSRYSTYQYSSTDAIKQQRDALGQKIEYAIDALVNDKYKKYFNWNADLDNEIHIKNSPANTIQQWYYPSVMEIYNQYYAITDLNFDDTILDEMKSEIENDIKNLLNNNETVQVIVHIVPNSTPTPVITK